MDTKMPKESVAELLKQLEELKRKKASKEKKLQKLKRHSSNGTLKERATNTSHSSRQRINCSEVSEKEIREDLQNLDKKIGGTVFSETNGPNEQNNLTLIKSDCNHLKNDNEITTNKKLDLSKVDNCKNKDSKKCIDVTNHKSGKHDSIDSSANGVNKDSLSCLNKSTIISNGSLKNNEFKTSDIISFKKPIFSNTEIKSKNFVLNYNDISLNVEESHPVVENLKGDETVVENQTVHDISYNVKKADVHERLSVNTVEVSASVPDIVNDVKMSNLPLNVNKLSDTSSKSLPSSKSKSSDILDDSLNSNMSFFMSADLFMNEYNDKKDLKGSETNFACVKNEKIRSEEKLESIPKIINHDLKSASHGCSTSSLNESQQNNVVFNFPKFSTPTEGIILQPGNDSDMLDSSKRSQIRKVSGSVEGVSSVAKSQIMSKALNSVLQVEKKNNFDQLKYGLEKRLSSVLDAHYESPDKTSQKNNISFALTGKNEKRYCNEIMCGEGAYKKRKLFTEKDPTVSLEPAPKLEEYDKNESNVNSGVKSNNALCKSFGELSDIDREMINSTIDFDNVNAFDSSSDSICDLKNSSHHSATLAANSCDDIPSQVTKAVNGLVAKICQDSIVGKPLNNLQEHVDANKTVNNEDIRTDSEVLIVPETEGLGLYLAKDTEDFLETSTLSQSLKDFPVNDNFLNVSSQSKLESPVVNNIVAAVKSSKASQSLYLENKAKDSFDKQSSDCCTNTPKKGDATRNPSTDTMSAFDNSLCLDTSFLEDDTQNLGNFKQVPYMEDENVQEKMASDKCEAQIESNLNFTCSLLGEEKEPVLDVEVIMFCKVKYAVILHKTCIYVWRQEKNKQWIKIFNHQVEHMFTLEKMCVSMDDDNLVIIMLLCNDEQYCLQFLIFEKDARVIKLMENTHWLEERHSKDSILLSGLNGLMFAIAQNSENSEVSIHAFISLKENPRLMTAVLGTTDIPLCSLCKIDKLPNALLGINDSMLYVWHILEARLVTAVSLHPHDYITIKECFWATVENGLIYFLTTCEDKDNLRICQLLAANLATGFCQSAMTYSTQPSNCKVTRITKAAYLEPFLVISHSSGAFVWSVMEEFCCASLSSKCKVTSIALSRDFKKWGILAVGTELGCINCYSIN